MPDKKQHSQADHGQNDRTEQNTAHANSSGQRESSRSGNENGRSERDSLQAREYRDERGEVHHHTKTYMDQHGKD